MCCAREKEKNLCPQKILDLLLLISILFLRKAIRNVLKYLTQL